MTSPHRFSRAAATVVAAAAQLAFSCSNSNNTSGNSTDAAAGAAGSTAGSTGAAGAIGSGGAAGATAVTTGRGGAAGATAGTTGSGGAAGAAGATAGTTGLGGTAGGTGGASAGGRGGTGVGTGGAAGTGGGAAGMGGASSGAGGGGRGGTGNVAGVSGAGGMGGAPCSDSVPCPSGSFCERDTPSACDAPTTAGHCIVPPRTCFLTVTPVCGCDGTPHYNDCARQAFSVHVDPAMRCPPNGNDGGTLGVCPNCDRATQYCEMKRVGTLDPPYFSACRPLPAACGANPTSCDCLANVSCGNYCNATTLGFPIVTCLPP